MSEKHTDAAVKERDDTVRENLPTVSVSPHIRSRDTSTGIMLDVIVALIPSLIASAALFGPRALAVTGVSVSSCLIFEYVSRKIMKRANTLSDLSAVVTGILLAFNLPPSIPMWMTVVGAFVAIVIVKQFFGGIGQNFVNPALMGRIILTVSFPAAMSKWTSPTGWSGGADAVTSATPLAAVGEIFKDGDFADSMFDALPTNLELFFGKTGGCLGETCAAAILLGMIYLIARRVISPVIPFVYAGTTALIMLIAGGGSIRFLGVQLLSGGLLLGAVFMATDYTTSPISTKGKLIYAAGCALFTCVIRLYGSFPEGVSFSIILMNILTPLIDLAMKPKPFGFTRKKKAVREADSR